MGAIRNEIASLFTSNVLNARFLVLPHRSCFSTEIIGEHRECPDLLLSLGFCTNQGIVLSVFRNLHNDRLSLEMETCGLTDGSWQYLALSLD